MFCLAREVVGGLESSRNALLNGSVTAVIGAEYGVLEATWVLDVDVELTVLATLGDSNAGANGSDVCVKDEGDEGPIVG